MSDPEANLARLGLELPDVPQAGGNYLPFRRAGRLLFLAGVIATDRDGSIRAGRVGGGVSIEEGRAAARLCALNALAAMRLGAGGLGRVRQIVSLSGYVNAVAGFDASPQVINGASDLLVEVFGEAGRHARAAVAVAGLPKNSTVEIQLVCELDHEA